MIFSVLTLFPELYQSFLQTSIIGRAVNLGIINVDLVQIRDFSENKHKKVDDTPYGGGSGMVISATPMANAVNFIKNRHTNPPSKVILLSPRGETLTHQKCIQLSQHEHIVLVCAHYEGVDQRFIDHYIDEEISIGDYILTGGELASMVVIESVSRLKAGVLGSSHSADDESFSNGLLEYPQYTKPQIFEGVSVPNVLLSGNHAQINEFRFLSSLSITKKRRPDLFSSFMEKWQSTPKSKSEQKRYKTILDKLEKF